MRQLLCGVICGLLSWNLGFCQTDVLTQHNDLGRTGWNSQETVLNTGNVNINTFGFLYARPVDDQVFAQPLIVSNVNIPSVGMKNILLVCTVNNSIYAFDADNQAVSSPYWQKNYTPAGYRPTVKTDMHPGLCGGYYNDFSNIIGLVGTPVIDKTSGTMYFVTKVVTTTPGVEDNHPFNTNLANEEYTYMTTGFHQYFHAVDITTGAEKANSPVEIIDTIPGTGDGSINGQIGFDPRRQFNRPGLVLSNGIVYVCFSAHCDWDPAHGWIMGFDASSLLLKISYMTTPNDGKGGIWMSGAAPAVDASGNLFVATGNSMLDENGFTDLPSDTVNRGESVVKLTPNAPGNAATALHISGFFTPFNYQIYDDADLDFSTQTLLVPGTNLLVTGVKGKFMYVLDQTNMGGFQPTGDSVLESFPVSPNAQFHSSFAYYGGTTGQWVYQFSENTLLESFKVNSNSLGNPVSGNVIGPTGASGAYMSVSSNGRVDSSAILWITHAVNGCNANQSVCSGILRAVRADDVTKELWNSTINPADRLGNFSKMNCPTIANGKVYVNTFSNQVMVYGLTSNNACGSYPDVAETANNPSATYSASSTTIGSAANAFDGSPSTSWTAATAGAGGGDTASIMVNLGAQYTICNVQLYWGSNYGKAYNILGSNDSVNFTLLYSVTQNTSATNVITIGNQAFQYIMMQGVTRSRSTSGYVLEEMQVQGQIVNPCATPANLSVSNISRNGATVSWQPVAGAGGYTIHYRSAVVSSWITRVTTDTSINLSALSCNSGYAFTVQANCSMGPSAAASSGFTTAACTAPCGALPTRYFNADIGDIGLAGSSCLNNGVYTIRGSGADIGGTGDQFQYAFTNLSGDEYVFAQVLSQDSADPADKAGLMFRDSISDISPFIFIGTTSSNGIVLEYRTVSDGATTIVNLGGPGAPYWLKINKTGTTYTAYISASQETTTWVQVGSPVNLGFGGAGAYLGMAVTSHNNSVLSTATFEDFTIVESGLSLKLTSFTGTNIDNQYVLLKWSTSSGAGCQYFDVEKSSDDVHFTEFARVDRAGDSSTVQYYRAYDYNPQKGANYYRLRIVNYDGTFTYSPNLQVDFGLNSIPQVFPNPASNYCMVASGEEIVKNISIDDVSGRQVISIDNASGSVIVNIDISPLANGVYIVKMSTASAVYEQKLIKK